METTPRFSLHLVPCRLQLTVPHSLPDLGISICARTPSGLERGVSSDSDMSRTTELPLHHATEDVDHALVEALMADLSSMPCIRPCHEHDCPAGWNPVIQPETGAWAANALCANIWAEHCKSPALSSCLSPGDRHQLERFIKAVSKAKVDEG